MDLLLMLLMVFENLFLYIFFRHGILGQEANAMGLFLSSFLFGLLLIYKFNNVEAAEIDAIPARKNILSCVMVLAAVTILVCMGIQFNSFFATHPLDHNYSDIIPCIQIACRRLLNGEFPYKVITEYGYPQQPNYFPMHWMPFSIAEMLKIDPRWITYGAWSIVATWLCFRSTKIPSKVIRTITPLLVIASFYFLTENNVALFEMTVEVLIAAYYMFLVISLNVRSGILQGIAISFCLLSRFSLVLWLPLYCFILFVTSNGKQLYTAVATSIVMVLVLYVIPFLSKDWGIFFRGFQYYDAGTLGEWTHLDNKGMPIHLFRGTGFAYYFYTHFPNLDIMGRIKLLQKAQLSISLLTTVILGAWFWLKRDTISTRVFLMASFKVYLAVFMFLIQVPYEYLMLVGNFVSIAIFCEQARYQLTDKKLIATEG